MNLYTITKEISNGITIKILATAITPDDAIQLTLNNTSINNFLQKSNGTLQNSDVTLIGVYNKNISKILQYNTANTSNTINNGPKLVGTSSEKNIPWIAAILTNLIYFIALASLSTHFHPWKVLKNLYLHLLF